jgi:hypothetical protein
MKKRFVFSVLIFISATVLTSRPIIAKADSCFYKINLLLVPEKQLLEASIDLTYYVDKERIDSLTFLLHRDLSIKTLTCANLAKYAFDTESSSPFPFSPKAGVLTIYLNKPIYKGETLQINFQYAGEIKRGIFEALIGLNINNRITEDWIEIGLYSPWFPFQPENRNLTYQVTVKIGPEYRVIGMGKTQKMDDYWEISEEDPTNDIVIMAAKDMKKSIQENSLSLDVNYYTLSDSTADDMMRNSSYILEKYFEWFGDIKASQVSIVVTPRSKGASYARRGFVVLTSFEDEKYYQNRIGYFQYIGHEFAHFWWTGAPTASWEDWLNESFAEYSSLMAVREKFGEESFVNRINEKQKRSKGLPAIKGIDRTSSEAHAVLYDKGCILLYALESQIGKESFLRLLKQTKINKVNSTEQFLKVLMDLTSVEVSREFEGKLNR